MNTPDHPSAPEHVPPTRVVAWLLVALALIVGVVLYFRHASQVAPLLDAVRGQ